MKTIITSFTFIMFFTCLNVFSQYQRQWVQRYNGYMEGSIDKAYAITADNNGNCYVTGYSSVDLTTIKYNASGGQEWVMRYNGGGWGSFTNVGYSIVVGGSDDAGNPCVYVTGAVRNNDGNYDIVTLKYSVDGTLLWNNPPTYNGPGNGDDIAKQIVVDADGNAYVTGKSMGINTNYDWVTIKYDASGKKIWVQRYNNNDVNRVDDPAALFCAG